MHMNANLWRDTANAKQMFTYISTYLLIQINQIIQISWNPRSFDRISQYYYKQFYFLKLPTGYNLPRFVFEREALNSLVSHAEHELEPNARTIFNNWNYSEFSVTHVLNVCDSF